jgi:hypothetical protein
VAGRLAVDATRARRGAESRQARVARGCGSSTVARAGWPPLAASSPSCAEGSGESDLRHLGHVRAGEFLAEGHHGPRAVAGDEVRGLHPGAGGRLVLAGRAPCRGDDQTDERESDKSTSTPSGRSHACSRLAHSESSQPRRARPAGGMGAPGLTYGEVGSATRSASALRSRPRRCARRPRPRWGDRWTRRWSRREPRRAGPLGRRPPISGRARC